MATTRAIRAMASGASVTPFRSDSANADHAASRRACASRPRTRAIRSRSAAPTSMRYACPSQVTRRPAPSRLRVSRATSASSTARDARIAGDRPDAEPGQQRPHAAAARRRRRVWRRQRVERTVQLVPFDGTESRHVIEEDERALPAHHRRVAAPVGRGLRQAVGTVDQRGEPRDVVHTQAIEDAQELRIARVATEDGRDRGRLRRVGRGEPPRREEHLFVAHRLIGRRRDPDPRHEPSGRDRRRIVPRRTGRRVSRARRRRRRRRASRTAGRRAAAAGRSRRRAADRGGRPDRPTAARTAAREGPSRARRCAGRRAVPGRRRRAGWARRSRATAPRAAVRRSTWRRLPACRRGGRRRAAGPAGAVRVRPT